MSTSQIPLPRYDFYQTPSEVILAVYVKGYAVEGVKEYVKVDFSSNAAVITLPPLSGDDGKSIPLEPLYAAIKSEASSFRVLSTKIELKLAKAESIQWPTLLADASSSPNPAPTTSNPLPPNASTAETSQMKSTAGPSSVPIQNQGEEKDTAEILNSDPEKKSGTAAKSKKKNWDRLIEDELVENEEENKDPNAGGDAALQKFFSQIYGNADPDTKRAMIKSFTESGGTTLSTDWSTIGKEKTPTRPPDGMEAKDF